MRRLIWTGLLLAGCPTPQVDDGDLGPPGPDATRGEQTSTGSVDDASDDDTGSTTTGSIDGSTTADTTDAGSTGEPTCPALPDPAPAWLPPTQQDLVARLSGASELSPGTTLSDRATASNRAATRDFLAAQLGELGLPATLHAYSETGANVYAALPATTSTDETVVVGAHFDTVPFSPGANDNATGVAMVLALARYLSELPCRERNVILVLFDEEEIGLVGSFAFASWLVEQSIDVVSVHTIDQMGWDADGDRALELERADRGLFEHYEQAEPLAPGDTPLVPTNTGFTDHVSFRELGFDAVGLTEEYVSGDTTPHYHLPGDTFDTVDLGYLASSTALLHVAIGQLVAPAG